MKKQCFLAAATGVFAGLMNGLFGSGGGIAAVPLYKKSKLSQKEAQATALFTMVALSALSAAIYLFEGQFELSAALPFLPGGVLGAMLSIFIFRRISPNLLQKIFGAFVTFSAIRILWGMLF